MNPINKLNKRNKPKVIHLICSRFENPNTQNRKKDNNKNKHLLKTSTTF